MPAFAVVFDQTHYYRVVVHADSCDEAAVGDVFELGANEI